MPVHVQGVDWFQREFDKVTGWWWSCESETDLGRKGGTGSVGLDTPGSDGFRKDPRPHLGNVRTPTPSDTCPYPCRIEPRGVHSFM